MKKKISVLMAAAMTVGVVAPTIASADSSVSKDGIEYMKRYSGSDRYQTAVDVSKSTFPENTTNLIIVNGKNPADALSGGPLASKLNAPILLTDSNRISTATLNEIARLNPTNVYILGGVSSVTKGIENVIKTKIKKDANLFRISGSNRYETSVMVAKAVTGGNTSTGAGFVNGSTEKFPDALSAAALLSSKNMPLILTNGRTLPNGADAYKLNGKNYIIGGTSSIDIAGLSGKRLAGSERYATSAVVAEEGFKDRVIDYTESSNANKSNAAVVVDGRNYPDALTAISLAKKNEAPILLVNSSLPVPISNYIAKQRRDKAFIVGGLSSVNNTVQALLLGRLEENYKFNRNGANLKIRSAVRELSDNIKKLDKYTNLLSKNDLNRIQMESYKVARDKAYNTYLKSGVSLGDAKEEAIKASNKEVSDAFENLAKADAAQAISVLSNEIINSLSKLEESSSKNPIETVKSSQDEYRKLINEAKTLKDKEGKGKEKLEMTIKLKEFNLRKESATVVEKKKATDSLIEKIESKLKIIRESGLRNDNIIKRAAYLQADLVGYKANQTEEKKEIIEAKLNDLTDFYDAYVTLDNDAARIDKVIKDNKNEIEKGFSTKTFKDKNLLKDKLNLEKLKLNIISQKDTINTEYDLRELHRVCDVIIKNAQYKGDKYRMLKSSGFDQLLSEAETLNTAKSIDTTNLDNAIETASGNKEQYLLSYKLALNEMKSITDMNIFRDSTKNGNDVNSSLDPSQLSMNDKPKALNDEHFDYESFINAKQELKNNMNTYKANPDK